MYGPAEELCDLLFVPTSQEAGLQHVHRGTTESAPKAPKRGGQCLQHQEVGQSILLVTEHNVEINAGFIVVFGSGHAPPVDETRWRSISAEIQACWTDTTPRDEADRLEQLYWALVKDILDTRKSVTAMSDSECALPK